MWDIIWRLSVSKRPSNGEQRLQSFASSFGCFRRLVTDLKWNLEYFNLMIRTFSLRRNIKLWNFGGLVEPSCSFPLFRRQQVPCVNQPVFLYRRIDGDWCCIQLRTVRNHSKQIWNQIHNFGVWTSDNDWVGSDYDRDQSRNGKFR